MDNPAVDNPATHAGSRAAVPDVGVDVDQTPTRHTRSAGAGRIAEWLAAHVLGATAHPHALPALDGVRAIAASLVFLVHYQAAFGRLLGPRGSDWRTFGVLLAQIGYHGVDVFFVLSGFLIYGSLVGRRPAFVRFLRRRVRRIYPTYLAVLGIYLLLSPVFVTRSKLPRAGVLAYVIENALLLPGVFPIRPIVTVSWSLSYEMFFYLGLAMAMAVIPLQRWTGKQRVLLLGALAVAWAISGPAVRGAVGTFIMFIPGMLLYELSRSRWAAPVRVRMPTASVWIVFCTGLIGATLLARAAIGSDLVPLRLPPELASPVLTVSLLTVGTIAMLLHAITPRAPATRWLERPTCRYVGVISYSFYLIHGLAINALALVFWRLVPVPPAGAAVGVLLYFALLPLAYVGAVLAATLLFVSVERPFSL